MILARRLPLFNFPSSLYVLADFKHQPNPSLASLTLPTDLGPSPSDPPPEVVVPSPVGVGSGSDSLTSADHTCTFDNHDYDLFSTELHCPEVAAMALEADESGAFVPYSLTDILTLPTSSDELSHRPLLTVEPWLATTNPLLTHPKQPQLVGNSLCLDRVEVVLRPPCNDPPDSTQVPIAGNIPSTLSTLEVLRQEEALLNPSQSKLSSSANVFSPTMLIASMEDPNRHTYTMTPLGSPTRASTPHISYPDIDLALPIYDSYHNIPDDDPHWTRTELDLNAIYIYDSDEDLSMYDNPPPSPWLTPQLSPPPPPRDSALYQPPSTPTLPNLRPTQHPTLEGLLEWQTRIGLRCCTSFVSPTAATPTSSNSYSTHHPIY